MLFGENEWTIKFNYLNVRINIDEKTDDIRHEVCTMDFPKHSNSTPLPVFKGTVKRLEEDGFGFLRHTVKLCKRNLRLSGVAQADEVEDILEVH